MSTDPFENDLGFSLSAASAGYEEEVTQAMRRDLGITGRKFRLLQAVECNPGVSNARLAELLRVSPQSCHAMVVAAALAGLVVRNQYAGQGNQNFCSITQKGRATLAQATRIANEVDARLRSVLRDGQAEDLYLALTRVRAEFGTG